MSNGPLLLDWRRRWNQSLLRFIGRRVRASIDIEDLAQETYLRLLRARNLGSVRSPHAYLLTVASHVLSEWRNRQPPEEAFQAVDENLLADEALPELALDAASWQAALDRALAAMPPVTRAVLVLRFREGRGCQQIAGDLRLTERQVRRHLTRGYEQLRGAVRE